MQSSTLPDQLIPDVVDEFHPTNAQLKVEFGPHVVNMGNILTPTQVKDMPHVHWNAEGNALYTLCMTDPDAPSRADPKNREWLHWLVVNIPGSEVTKGHTVVGYIGSAPPKGSGLHRYVLLLYKQSAKIEPTEKHLTSEQGAGREKFKIRAFAKKYNMHLQDVKYYQAEWDDYVPKVYAKLKD